MIFQQQEDQDLVHKTTINLLTDHNNKEILFKIRVLIRNI